MTSFTHHLGRVIDVEGDEEDKICVCVCVCVGKEVNFPIPFSFYQDVIKKKPLQCSIFPFFLLYCFLSCPPLSCPFEIPSNSFREGILEK